VSLDRYAQSLWYGPAWRSWPLWPLEAAFRLLSGLRRALYRRGWLLQPRRLARPVIVVGNVTVGGTGKTPLVGWLARELGGRGLRVGIVLRGYRGAATHGTTLVTAASEPADVGDEAVLHAAQGAHVVVTGADRVAAGERAVAAGAEVIVSDDGLQHYRLHRDCEIAVLDAERWLGNGHLLPAGPLREPPGRLTEVTAVVVNHRSGATVPQTRDPAYVTMHVEPGAAVNLVTGETRPLEAFRGRRLHAVAAIGHPEAFFRSLRAAGLDLLEHALPDHAPMTAATLAFATAAEVLMTQKDAVKCRAFARPGWWYVPAAVRIAPDDARRLLVRVLDSCGLAAAAGVRSG